MATQCGINNAATMGHHHHLNNHHHHNNNHHPFVSSNAYYGYVPVVHLQESTQPVAASAAMDVDGADDVGAATHRPRVTEFLTETVPERRCLGARKRGLAVHHDEVVAAAAYMPRFKRFREEAVVTNVFSMVQETASGQKSMDWPRCTMNHYYA